MSKTNKTIPTEAKVLEYLNQVEPARRRKEGIALNDIFKGLKTYVRQTEHTLNYLCDFVIPSIFFAPLSSVSVYGSMHNQSLFLLIPMTSAPSCATQVDQCKITSIRDFRSCGYVQAVVGKACIDGHLFFFNVAMAASKTVSSVSSK